MSVLQIFDDPETNQYFIDDFGVVWLHGNLVCKRLGFKNPSEAIRLHTEADERRQIEFPNTLNNPWFVNEYGVWGMILAAKTQEAKDFKRYLKYEVLPSIRKTGVYATEEAKKQIKAIVLAILYSDTVSVEALNETHLATSAFVETFAKNRAIAKNPEIAKAFNGLIDCFTKNPIYRNEINTGYAATFLHLDKLIDLFGLDKNEIMEEYHKNKIYPYPQRIWKSFGLKNDHSTD